MAQGTRHLGLLWQHDGTASAETYRWGSVAPESLPVGTMVSLGDNGELIKADGSRPLFGVIGFSVNNALEYATVITSGCVNARGASTMSVGQPPYASSRGIVREHIIGEIEWGVNVIVITDGVRTDINGREEVADCIRLQLL